MATPCASSQEKSEVNKEDPELLLCGYRTELHAPAGRITAAHLGCRERAGPQPGSTKSEEGKSGHSFPDGAILFPNMIQNR